MNNKILYQIEINAILWAFRSTSTGQARQKAFKRSLDELIANGKVFKQKTENGTELVLKTDNGQTHPPL